MIDRLLQRDGDDCFYCLLELGEDCSIEHLESWAAGGSNHSSNLALAHCPCNLAMKDLTVDQKMLARGDALLAALAVERVAA